MVDAELVVSTLDEIERVVARTRREVIRERDLIEYWGVESDIGKRKIVYVDNLVNNTKNTIEQLLSSINMDE